MNPYAAYEVFKQQIAELNLTPEQYAEALAIEMREWERDYQEVKAAGGLFVSARHYRNKPLDLGFEDWRPASMTEFSRIASNLERTRKAKLPLIYRAGCGIAILAAMLFVALITMAAELRVVSRFIAAATTSDGMNCNELARGNSPLTRTRTKSESSP